MADDPTVQLSLRRRRECPTCGHNVQPEDIECSLCGTTLPHDLPFSVAPPNPSSRTPADPPLTESSEPTVVAPLPSRSPRTKEKATKAGPASPLPFPSPPASPQEIKREEETAKALSQTPRSVPLREMTDPTARPAAASPAPRPVAPIASPPGAPLGSRTVQPPVSSLPMRSQSNALTNWGGLVGGALAFLLVGVFAGKLLFEGEEVVPLPTREERKESLPPPPPLPRPQPTGYVTTAEQLLPVRIFGADLNDDLRGSAAFRTEIERGLPRIRDAYAAQIVNNLQLFGTVVLELTFAPEGQVMNAALHTTGNISRDLQQVILNAIKEWRLAPVQGEAVSYFYPLLLSPEKVEAATFISSLREVWPGRYKVLAATPVPVRSQAEVNAERIGTLSSGLFFSVVSSQAGWLGALSPKGKVGYVRREDVFPREESNS